jgi:hypothetical protein
MRHSAIEEESTDVAYEIEPKEKNEGKPMPGANSQFSGNKMPQTGNKRATKHALRMSNRYKEHR